MRAQEDRAVELTTLVRDAVANATANVMRKRGKRAIPLFRKRKKAECPSGQAPRGNILQLFEGIERAERGRNERLHSVGEDHG